jgi:hypothetical protein
VRAQPTNDRKRIVLELVELPSDRPLAIRLRLVLKDLLRRQQLRCVSIHEAPAAADPAPATEEDNPDGRS